MRLGRDNHCMVQIDDCRVAIIGGYTGIDANGTGIRVGADNFIDIFNTEDSTWNYGPG